MTFIAFMIGFVLGVGGMWCLMLYANKKYPRYHDEDDI